MQMKYLLCVMIMNIPTTTGDCGDNIHAGFYVNLRSNMSNEKIFHLTISRKHVYSNETIVQDFEVNLMCSLQNSLKILRTYFIG